MSNPAPVDALAALSWSHRHFRLLLPAAIAAIAALALTVVLLAVRSAGHTIVIAPGTPDPSQTGARLDHRGLAAVAPVRSPVMPDASQTGARLDHRGLHYTAP